MSCLANAGQAPCAERRAEAGRVQFLSAAEEEPRQPHDRPIRGTWQAFLCGQSESEEGLCQQVTETQGVINLPNGGSGRNRTGVDGFAVRCITTLPPSH